MLPIDAETLNGLTREQLIAALEVHEEEQRRRRQRQFFELFPDDGPNARHLYPKHLEFFEYGATMRERCFMAANRVGKTVGGGYELACHLTGLYPDWWPGSRFPHPIRAWAAGKTNETTRDIVQAKTLGPIAYTKTGRKTVSGEGIIPGEHLAQPSWKQGVPDLVDTIKVKHKSGGWSVLGLKSYQQGRGSFEGTEQDVIWLDEEPPLEIYGECLIRTATTKGLILLTFTPLEGMSEVVMQFLPRSMRPEGV